MQTFQYYGPFKEKEYLPINLSAVYRIVQIGIENRHSIPIRCYENNKINIKPIISIDGIEYAVMDNDILEFSGLYQKNSVFQILRDLDEYTIIDIAFKDVDE